MKAYIISFLTLLVGLTLTTACTDLEDWDHGMDTKFPESVPFGYYHTDSRNFSGLYDYGVVLTKNAAGNPVYYLLLEGRDGTSEAGNYHTAMYTTDVNYDQKTGVMTVFEPQSFFDGAASSYIIYNYEKPDLQNLLMQVSYTGDNKETKSISKVAAGVYPNVVSRWKGTSPSGKTVLLDLKAAGENGTLTAEVTVDGTALTSGSYAVSGATTTVTTAEKTFTASYNDLYQYVVTIDGESFVLDRVVSDPIPETYTEFAAGIIAYGTDVLVGKESPFAGEVNDAILYKSDKFSNKYLLAPYAGNGEGIVIMVHEDGDKATFSVNSQVVYTFNDGEKLLVTDIVTCGAEQIGLDTSKYPLEWKLDKEDELKLHLLYHVGNYSLFQGYGIFTDQFVITERLSGEKQQPWSVVKAKKAPLKSFLTDVKPQSLKF